MVRDSPLQGLHHHYEGLVSGLAFGRYSDQVWVWPLSTLSIFHTIFSNTDALKDVVTEAPA